MSTIRYYFPSAVDDSLVDLAILAKDVLINNHNLISVYQKNNEVLYGQSPRRRLYLMKQNNKSIFSSSSTSESSSPVIKSNQEPSTSVISDPNVPTRYLSSDDANNKESPVATLETSIPVRHQTVLVSGKDKDATVGEIAKVDEHFVSHVASTDSPGQSNQESPHSAEIVVTAADLNMDEKALESPTKVADSHKTANWESLRSSEVIKMSTALTVNEQNTVPILVSGATGGLSISGQKFPRTAEMLSSTPAEDDDESKTLDGDQSLANLATNTDTLDTKNKVEVYNDAVSISNDCINQVEGTVEIPEPTAVGNETPSPIKRLKICSISATDIKELTSTAEMVRMLYNSPKESKVTMSPPKDDKMNINPNEASIEIVSDQRKRKSPKPKKNITFFRSIPRVVQSIGQAEIDIEVSYEIEDTASSTTSQNSLMDYNSDKTIMKNLVKEDIKSAGGEEYTTETSPKSIERFLNPVEKPIFANPSDNVTKTHSSESNDNIFFLGQRSSGISSISATVTEERLAESIFNLTNIKIEPTSLKYKVIKFEGLLAYRNQVMKRTFQSLLFFQNNLQFLNSYINNLGYVVHQIGLSDKEYINKELKEIVNDTIAVASKLEKRLTSWIGDIDLDIQTWRKCFGQIQQRKAEYGSILSKKGQISIEAVQVYECDMRTIWKIMDDMIMMGDSRRSLFSQTAHDFEMMMILFVKCLIYVGILRPRERILS